MGTTLRHVIFDIGGGIQDGQRVQGRADRRTLGRLRAGRACSTCRSTTRPRRDRRDHGLRRPGRRRRQHLHGRPRPVLPAVHAERELRQVRALPRRHQAHARDPRAHHRAARARTATSSASRRWRVTIKRTSLCGLGQTAPNPVLTTLRYFRDEYEAHIDEQRCPALACKALIAYTRRPGGLHRLHAVRQEVPVDAATGDGRRRRTSSTRSSASRATPAAPPASSTRSRSSAAREEIAAAVRAQHT